MKKFLTVLKWTAATIAAVFILLVIIRVPHAIDAAKTAEQVAKIHATKLTMDDVLGTNLPPDPGPDADKTVAGIDANHNGIRDDVELAIFKEYPNSAKTRAALLQYALALQMEFTQPFLETENVIAVVQEGNRGSECVADALVPRETPETWRSQDQVAKIRTFTNFVESKQLNTKDRVRAEENFYQKIGSYNSLESSCDIDYSKLPN